MMMGVAEVRVAALFASLLVMMSVQGVPLDSQDLELTLDREMTFLGTHDPCGLLTCRVKGNSVTLDTVIVTENTAVGEARDLLTVTATKPNSDVSVNDIRGNGTLENNRATIYLDLLGSSLCDSGHFTCEVIFTKSSGERERQLATAGPGHPPSFQAHPQSPQVVPELQRPWPRPANPYAPEHWFLKDQVNEVKFESLDGRLNQITSRASRLEDRVDSLFLRQSPASGPNTTKILEELKGRVAELEASKETAQTGDEPRVCERGMGDDVTKSYRPYVTLTHSATQKQILCDTQTDGGGWIVIQRRAKGDVDFFKDWTAYREGFGSVSGDFWMGNEDIHKLTDEHPYELRIDFRIDGQEKFARYSSFRIENEADKYRLRLGAYTGTIGGSSTTGLSYSNNYPFSTFDRDNDSNSGNCAISDHGAWWYRTCHRSNLNGMWAERSTTKGVSWHTGSGWIYGINFTEMKIRRVQSNTSG